MLIAGSGDNPRRCVKEEKKVESSRVLRRWTLDLGTPGSRVVSSSPVTHGDISKWPLQDYITTSL